MLWRPSIKAVHMCPQPRISLGPCSIPASYYLDLWGHGPSFNRIKAPTFQYTFILFKRCHSSVLSYRSTRPSLGKAMSLPRIINAPFPPAIDLPCLRPSCMRATTNRCNVCLVASYCSDYCLQLDWASHIPCCKSFNKSLRELEAEKRKRAAA